MKRHALAVVAGAATARSERQPAPRAAGDDGADLVLGFRPRHRVGAPVAQLALQQRAEPGEVLAQPLDARIGDPLDGRQLGGKRRAAGLYGPAIERRVHRTTLRAARSGMSAWERPGAFMRASRRR